MKIKIQIDGMDRRLSEVSTWLYGDGGELTDDITYNNIVQQGISALRAAITLVYGYDLKEFWK